MAKRLAPQAARSPTSRGRSRPRKRSRVTRARRCPGIRFFKESRRYYPNSELAAHVLGYVGLDNVGLGGHRVDLRRADPRHATARCCIQTDARRHAMFSRVERPPTAGAGLELTIDEYLQHIAERELRVGVEENDAAGGTAIIMDPHTGEILALANWPTFNPNAFTRRGRRRAAQPRRSRTSTSRARRSRSSPRRPRSRST